jgi:hypothetical protein
MASLPSETVGAQSFCPAYFTFSFSPAGEKGWKEVTFGKFYNDYNIKYIILKAFCIFFSGSFSGKNGPALFFPVISLAKIFYCQPNPARGERQKEIGAQGAPLSIPDPGPPLPFISE